jgi:predicted naringenin-chalcone synthase
MITDLVYGKLESMGTTTAVEIRKEQGLWQLRPRIPRSWKAAAGILRRRRVDPLEYQKQVRQQWERSSDITST